MVMKGVLLTALTATCGVTAGERLCGVEDADEVLIDFRTKKAKITALGANVTRGNGLSVRFPKARSGVMLSATWRTGA